MWKEEYVHKTDRRRWRIKRTLEAIYHKDSLGRIIYFKTREAACRRAWELNEVAEATSHKKPATN